jgi:hypothetical protein
MFHLSIKDDCSSLGFAPELMKLKSLADIIVLPIFSAPVVCVQLRSAHYI